MSKYIVDMDEYIELIANKMSIEANSLLYNNKSIYKVDNNEFETDCILAMQFFAANMNMYIGNEYIICLTDNLNNSFKVDKKELTSDMSDSYLKFYGSRFPNFKKVSEEMEVALKYSAINSLLFTFNENLQKKSNYKKMAITLSSGVICVDPYKAAVSSVVSPNREMHNALELAEKIEQIAGIKHETKTPTF